MGCKAAAGQVAAPERVDHTALAGRYQQTGSGLAAEAWAAVQAAAAIG